MCRTISPPSHVHTDNHCQPFSGPPLDLSNNMSYTLKQLSNANASTNYSDICTQCLSHPPSRGAVLGLHHSCVFFFERTDVRSILMVLLLRTKHSIPSCCCLCSVPSCCCCCCCCCCCLHEQRCCCWRGWWKCGRAVQCSAPTGSRYAPPTVRDVSCSM